MTRASKGGGEAPNVQRSVRVRHYRWSIADLGQLKGIDVVGRSGERIGRVTGIYCDMETSEPEWIHLSLSPLGAQKRLLPMDDATPRDGKILVPYNLQKVKHEPRARIRDHEILQQDERALCDYFGLDGHPSGAEHRSILYI